MGKKVIITCAVTGGGDTVKKHPGVPITPEQIAKAAVDSGKAGASIAHIHVRDPKTGGPSLELVHYHEVVKRIRDSGSDIIINLTTGPGSRFVPSDEDPRVGGPGTTMRSPLDRVQHVIELRPEICSLDIGSMNFGETGFVNIPSHLRQMAKAIAAVGVKPELEVFDAGHVMLARQMIDDGEISSPPLFQLCLGVPWGMPATSDAMSFMRGLLPPDAIWSGFGISRMQFPMVAQAAILGGHARVGLEDNLYIEQGVLAETNAVMVERAVHILESLGASIARPTEARLTLGLRASG